MSKFFIQIASVLLVPSFALSMTITSDTTWTSNLSIPNGATIKNGATLTINSGVEVTVGLNKGIVFENGSKLIAIGTTSNQVEFKSSSGTWDGLFFEETAKHKMGNVKISNAETGIFQDSTSSVVVISGLEFDNCEKGVVFNNTSSINGVIASRFNCSEFSILANNFTMIQNNLFKGGDYGIIGDSLKTAKIKNNTFVNVAKVVTNKSADSTYAFGSAIFHNNIVSGGTWDINTTSSKFDSLYVISSCFYNTSGISQADSNLYKMFACIYDDPKFADTIDYKLTSNFDESNNDILSGITSSPCIDQGTRDKDLIPTVPTRPESGIIISDENSNAYGEEIKFENLASFSILPPNVPNSVFFTPLHNLGTEDFVYEERSAGSVLEEFGGVITWATRPEAQFLGIVDVNPVYPITSFKISDFEPFEETIIEIDELGENGTGNASAQGGEFQTVIKTRVEMSEFGTGAANEGSTFGSTNIKNQDLSQFGANTERFPFGKYPNMGHNGGLYEASINISQVINGRSTSSNETWSGNIILKNDFEISSGDTLFIKEGTQVLITAQNGSSPSNDEKNSNLVEIICKGTIVFVQDIDTLKTQPTIFKTNSSNTFWYGIRYLDSSTDQNLNWALIENAKIGVEIENPDSATEFNFEDNLFVGFDEYGIYSKENDLKMSVKNNLFSNSNQSTASYGVYLEGDSEASIDPEDTYILEHNFFKNINGNGILVRAWAADLRLNMFHETEAPIHLSGIEEELKVYGNLLFGAKINAIAIENSDVMGGVVSKNFFKKSTSMSTLRGIYYRNSEIDSFTTNLIDGASYGVFMIDIRTEDTSIFEDFIVSADNDESSQYGFYVSQSNNPKLKFSKNIVKDYAQGGYYFYRNTDMEIELGDAEDSSPSIIQGENTENRCVYGMYFANNTNTTATTVKVRKMSTGYTNNAIFIKENNSTSLTFDLGNDCEEDLGNNSFYLAKSKNLIWNENPNITINGEGNFWGDSSGTLIQDVENASKNFDLNCFLNVDPNKGSIPKISIGNFKGTFKLNQNYPNPFNPTTNIEFFVPSEANVKIEVFNILGQSVRTLTNAKLKAGSHAVTWNGTDNNSNLVGTGIYFYRITSDNFKQTRKMLLIK